MQARDLHGLRVCFVAGTLGPGGAERQLYYILTALKDHGAEPRLLCLTRGELWEERLRDRGIEVTWVGESRSRIQRLRRIVSELRATRADVVQSQHFYTNIYVAAAARMVGVPGIGALRSDGLREVRANGTALGRLSLSAPRLIAANSRTGIENAVALGVPRERLFFLPNVVDTAWFRDVGRNRRDEVTLLSVGRLVPVKRFDRLLRAVARVRESMRIPFRVVIVGDGPTRPALEQQIRDLRLMDCVELSGTRTDLRPHYARADLLVLSSDYEGTPNVVLEAMSSGLPVTATWVGGVADVVADGRSGYLVDPWDESGLANAIADLVAHAERRRAFGAHARRLVAYQHGLLRLAPELERLYATALGRAAA